MAAASSCLADIHYDAHFRNLLGSYPGRSVNDQHDGLFKGSVYFVRLLLQESGQLSVRSAPAPPAGRCALGVKHFVIENDLKMLGMALSILLGKLATTTKMVHPDGNQNTGRVKEVEKIY